MARGQITWYRERDQFKKFIDKLNLLDECYEGEFVRGVK